MYEKIYKVIQKDQLFLHKIGVGLGTALGIVLGGIISKEADKFETYAVEESVAEGAENGPQEN